MYTQLFGEYIIYKPFLLLIFPFHRLSWQTIYLFTTLILNLKWASGNCIYSSYSQPSYSFWFSSAFLNSQRKTEFGYCRFKVIKQLLFRLERWQLLSLITQSINNSINMLLLTILLVQIQSCLSSSLRWPSSVLPKLCSLYFGMCSPKSRGWNKTWCW